MKTLKLLFLSLVTISLFGQGQDPETVEIKTEKVADGIYMLIGMGGNIGVSVGEDGVFMIDDQFAPLTDKIVAAIAEISDKSVRFVINTHWHYDHTGGNENFGERGSVIVAHENVRKRMAAGQFMEDFGQQVDPATKSALPVITFTRDLTFHLNGEEIAIRHLSRAHTDGDAIVHFKTSNVLHMGDIFFSGMYPYIDVGSGGNGMGVIAAVERAVAMCDENTKIMPGHGPVSTRDDLKMYHAMLSGVRDAVKKHVDAGRSLEDTIAAKPTAAWDEEWSGFINGDRITKFFYNSMKQ